MVCAILHMERVSMRSTCSTLAMLLRRTWARSLLLSNLVVVLRWVDNERFSALHFGFFGSVL
jgi:hypothetical protein